MNKYLITGGAGFIGSHFINYLINREKNCEVYILDKLTYAGDISRLKLSMKHSNVKFIKGDINDSLIIKALLNEHRINRIVNFAAETHVDRSIVSQKEFIETNVLGVQNILSTSKEVWETLGLEDILFIQISTDEVYGPSSKEDSKPFHEESLLNPMNPYAASKASAELLIKSYMNTFNYPANIIRSTNNYGVNQNEEKFIPKIITSYLDNQRITVYGTGKNRRCWLYVEDNCRGIYEIMHSGKNKIYNIKGNHTTSNIDLAKYIIKVLKNDYKIPSRSKIVFVKDRKGHDYYYNVSNKKIKKTLAFNLRISFEEGLKRVIDSYIKNSSK